MTNKVAEIRRDLARAAYAAAHDVDPADLHTRTDMHGVQAVEDAIDKVLIHHGVIDFDKHFPHEHFSDKPDGRLCTFTAPTGEMCQEIIPDPEPRATIPCGHPINYQRRWTSGDGVMTYCTVCDAARLITFPSTETS